MICKDREIKRTLLLTGQVILIKLNVLQAIAEKNHENTETIETLYNKLEEFYYMEYESVNANSAT